MTCVVPVAWTLRGCGAWLFCLGLICCTVQYRTKVCEIAKETSEGRVSHGTIVISKPLWRPAFAYFLPASSLPVYPFFPSFLASRTASLHSLRSFSKTLQWRTRQRGYRACRFHCERGFPTWFVSTSEQTTCTPYSYVFLFCR